MPVEVTLEPDEDGLVSPSKSAMRKAVRVVRWLRERGKPRPTSIVQDGDGGIAINHRRGTIHEKIHVHADGRGEYLQFVDSELRERLPLELNDTRNCPHCGRLIIISVEKY